MRIGYREVKRDLRVSDIYGIESLQVSVVVHTVYIGIYTQYQYPRD